MGPKKFRHPLFRGRHRTLVRNGVQRHRPLAELQNAKLVSRHMITPATALKTTEVPENSNFGDKGQCEQDGPDICNPHAETIGVSSPAKYTPPTERDFDYIGGSGAERIGDVIDPNQPESASM